MPPPRLPPSADAAAIRRADDADYDAEAACRYAAAADAPPRFAMPPCAPRQRHALDANESLIHTLPPRCFERRRAPPIRHELPRPITPRGREDAMMPLRCQPRGFRQPRRALTR